MFKKILVPVDGSEKAVRAALHGAELATKMDSELILFYVAPLLPPYTGKSPVHLINIQQVLMDEYIKQGHGIIAQLKDDLAAYGLNISTYITIGQPADEIIKKAKETGCNLIVMGSRGLGEIKGYLMGSVSNHVTRYATCPVLVVR